MACVTHAGHVHDVTDTDCGAQYCITHGRAFATFKRLFFYKQDEKLSEKLL